MWRCGAGLSREKYEVVIFRETTLDEYDKANAYLDAGQGEEAIPIFRRLAEQGRVAAMHSIAHTYLYGVAGVDRDHDQAFAWFNKGASNGCPQAMYHLGVCNANGYGTPVDQAQSAEWYRRSAERGDEDAMYEMGNCCEKGLGVDEDVEEARRWYRKAADRGQEAAAERLRALDS